MASTVLYLVRHSKAESQHPAGDRFRALSPEGRQRIVDLGPAAEARGFRGDLALASPYLRARQTRDLFQPIFQAPREAESRAFVPEADPDEAIAVLESWRQEGFRALGLFTHNPLVTSLAATLARDLPPTGFVFHTPTIVALGFAEAIAAGQGRVLWTLHP